MSLAAYWRRRLGLDGAPASQIAVQALVAGERPAMVSASAQTARAQGARSFKLKLGADASAAGFANDIERVGALRASIGAEAAIRLDANEAWTREQAERALRALAKFSIDFVEQPLARDDFEGMAALTRDAPVAVAADEALLGGGLARCLDSHAARILVAKPAAMGGFEAALALARQAADRGLRLIWSSLLDGRVSRYAAIHLAAASAPNGDSGQEVHGLGTGPLLEADFDTEPSVEEIVDGTIAVPTKPGLGFDVAIRTDACGAVGTDPFVGAMRTIGAHA